MPTKRKAVEDEEPPEKRLKIEEEPVEKPKRIVDLGISPENIVVGPRERSGKTVLQLDRDRGSLAVIWRTLTLCGKQDKRLVFKSKKAEKPEKGVKIKKKHSCNAEAIMEDESIYLGAFHGEHVHAEMQVLENIVLNSKLQPLEAIDAIRVIHIEKEPCPRCAVVLNKFQLSAKVKYKASGQKDYPTWRFPNFGNGFNWIETMGVREKAPREAEQEELLNFFCTQKWW